VSVLDRLRTFLGRDGERVAVPTTLQMEAAECGAAALSMVLAHHGRNVSLEELRAACGVSRDGSKASNISRAAERYGLEASAYRLEPDELDDIELPAIIHWNFNHFLVYEGRLGRRYYLNDPATGPRVVDAEELGSSFTGVAMTFEPTPEFVKGGDRPNVLDMFVARVPSVAPAVIFIVLANLALIVPGLAVPTMSRIFVDDILIASRTEWLPGLLLGLLLTALMRMVFTGLTERAMIRAQLKLSVVGTSTFFWQLLRLPVQFFSSRFSGDLASRLSVNDRIASTINNTVVSGFIALISVVFFGVLLVWFNFKLAVVVFVNAAISTIVTRVVSRHRVHQSTRLQADIGKLAGVASSGLRMIESIKASGAESDFFARWAGYQAKVVSGEQRLAENSTFLAVTPSVLTGVGDVVLIAFGASLIMDGQLTIGGLVAFQSLAASFLGPLHQVLHLVVMVKQAEGDANRLEDIMLARRDPQVEQKAEVTDMPLRLAGQLSLRDVTFGYSPLEPPLISGFSLELKPGKRVALVGGSGSGKSTLAKLISGLYEPWSGEIRFDGLLRTEIPRSLFVNSVAVVDQDIFMFEGTVRENLTLWDQSVPESALVAAAKDACIHDDITMRVGGYDGPVAEGGRNFSGGQRQRMEIARALVVSPSLLLLDEATSALDPTTEQLIDDNLRRRGVACVVVAHRLSTIRDCDEIIVLERGRIVERGSHQELYAAGGAYRALVDLDMGGGA
jgi:NHLM bacteriocin system ABC transporter peptidase/ATP-binding protein